MCFICMNALVINSIIKCHSLNPSVSALTTATELSCTLTSELLCVADGDRFDARVQTIASPKPLLDLSDKVNHT